MTTTTRLMTADELLVRPDDGLRHELIDGELRTMAPAGSDHGSIHLRLGTVVGGYVAAHRLGVLFGADTGFRLRGDPDTVRAPDLSFVSARRIPAGGRPGPKYFEGAPDLAVEVLSPSDTVGEGEAKLTSFFAAGCRLGWLIDPARETLTVYLPPGTPARVLGPEDILDGGDVLPGFACRVRDALYWPV